MTKFKKNGLLLALLISVFTVNINAYAAEVTEKIRVGLTSYANKSEIKISNSSLYIGKDDNGDFCELGKIYSNGFVVQLPNGYYVDCLESFSSYDDAYDSLNDYDDYGYDAYPAMTEDDDWTIYICNIPTSDEARSIAGLIGGDAVTSTSTVIEITDGSKIVAVADGVYPQVSPLGDKYITLGTKSYRGVMEFGRYKGDNITAVNVVTMDEYLYSVVPSEMPYSWHEEALKAQIVAARSYTCTRLTAHLSEGYQVCDGTNCQVYNGVNSEKSNVNALIDETSGIYALYDGEPINAVYCSSSGGHTDNCENVWSAVVPYLRGVKEIFGTKGTSWSRTYSASEISALCSTDGANVGQVISIDITVSTLTGRVQKMTINGSNGSHSVSKDGIRSFFSSNGGYLPSRMFTLNGLGVTDYEGAVFTDEDVIMLTAVSPEIHSKYNTNGVFTIDGQKFAIIGNYTPTTQTVSEDTLKTFTASGSSYNFSGYGNGHGIGMSQHGAKEMAENGYTYDEILKHYYTGIEVKRI